MLGPPDAVPRKGDVGTTALRGSAFTLTDGKAKGVAGVAGLSGVNGTWRGVGWCRLIDDVHLEGDE